MLEEEVVVDPGECQVEWFASDRQSMLADLGQSEERVAELLQRVDLSSESDAVRSLVVALQERVAELSTDLVRLQEDLDAATRLVVGLRADVRWDSAFNFRKDFRFRFHDGDVEQSLRVCQSPVSASVGFVAWQAGFVLCNHLIERFGVAGRNRGNGVAVELGCGTGLAGLVASRLGFDVTLTDTADTLPIAERNVRENGGSVPVRVVPLPWGDAAALSAARLPAEIDLIIGSELLYARDMAVYESLCATVLALATARTELLFVFEDRDCDEQRFFDALLRPHFEEIVELKRTTFNPSNERSWIHLVRVAGRRGVSAGAQTPAPPAAGPRP